MPFSLAKSETYGPIKGGQNLWDIANETRTDKTISVEQLAYSIYQLNPDAFYSSNMNLLHIGVVLNIPDAETVLKTSKPEAQQQLQQHVHALDLIRVDAKQLRKAKITRSKYKKQIKVLQKRLGKYRHKSRDWNKTYTQLVTAKRNYSKSKRKVVKLTGLLLEKATLKSDSPVKKVVSTTAMTEVNQRLAQIQSSLENLNHFNTELVEKVAQLATLNKRVKVIEEELGKNDDLVIQLKNTLDLAQQAIKEQQLKSEYLDQRLEKLDSINSSQIDSDAIDKTTSAEAKEESVVKTSTTSNIQTFENNKNESSPTVTTENQQQENPEVTTENTSNPEVTAQIIDTKPVENNETEPTPVITTKIKEQDNNNAITEDATKPEIMAQVQDSKPTVKEDTDPAIANENKDQDSSDIATVDVSGPVIATATPTETESELVKNDAEVEASSIEIDTSIPQIVESDEIENTDTAAASDEMLLMKEEENIVVNETENKKEEANKAENEVATKVEENIEIASDKFSMYEFEAESLAVDISDGPIVDNKSSEITQANPEATGTNTNTIDQGSLKRTKLTDANYPIAGSVPRKEINTRSRNGSTSDSSTNYWIQLLKDKIIIIGGILNGIILLFVFYKLFSNGQPALELEDTDTESEKSNGYIPWQDRVKPKRRI